MKNLVLNSEPDTPYYPEVVFNAETGICEISGESYMEEAYKFYAPLIDWLKEFVANSSHELTINFKLIYFNTSSSRLLVDFLETLRKIKEDGRNVTVNWYYDPEDPDVKDEVEDFEIESGMEINLKEK
ncbi:MAG: DUF1987 domain-containing protein [Bacteroidales bacterium]|nr:DUF1987 domain-containing protein [Bacteroidales bacterium]MBN2817839.1 DUF1987 domain-containing protein [Bacteroidales bacterium]